MMSNCIRCHKQLDTDGKFCPYCGAKQERNKGRRQRGNGTGTAFKDGNKWTARVIMGWRIDEEGISRPIMRVKRGFKTKQEALQYIPILRGEREKVQNLDHYWQVWSRSDMEQLSDSKQTAYRIAYKKLGNLVYRDISTITVDELKSTVQDACKTYYTARDVKSLLRVLYSLADADGIGNPRLPSYIKLPKLQEKEGQAFTEEQISRIWSAYDSGDTFLGYVLLMIYTGMMPVELLGMKIDNIDIDNHQIVGAGRKTKVRKATPITISDIIAPVLLALMNQSDGKRLVPFSRDTFYSQYHTHMTAAGVRDLPPYSCRHTTATALAVGENVAPQVIRRVMRWSTTKMLSRYAHADNTDALDAVNRIKKG